MFVVGYVTKTGESLFVVVSVGGAAARRHEIARHEGTCVPRLVLSLLSLRLLFLLNSKKKMRRGGHEATDSVRTEKRASRAGHCALRAEI